MKRFAAKFLAFCMTLIMIMPVTNLYAEEAEPDGYIALRMFNAQKEDISVFFYNTFSPINEPDINSIGKEYKGISVDVPKRLITFKNVNLSGSFCIDIFSENAFSVNLIGTNTLDGFTSHSAVTFTGSGTLTLKDNISSENIINASDTTNITIKGLISKGLQVGPNATFTIEQPTIPYNSGLDKVPATSLVMMHFTEKMKQDELIKYAGTVNEPIKWYEYEELSNSYDAKIVERDKTTKYYLADFDANDALYINNNTGDCYLRTNHLVPYDYSRSNADSLELTKITYDAQTGIWKESEQANDTYTNFEGSKNALTESNYTQYSAFTKSLFPATVSENSAMKGYVRFNSDDNWGSGFSLYINNGKKYIFVNYENINTSVYPDYSGFVFERMTGAFTYYKESQKVPGGEAYPTYAYSEIDNPDFKPIYYHNYFAYNQKLVFSPKPANTDPGTGNNDNNKTTDPGKDDQKTEAPKSGDTVQKDNGDFKLSEDKSGNMTAEFSSNEKTDGQKSVTIPETVEVNGKEVPVTAIADNAFSGNKSLTTLKFKGKNLQKIGKNAFSKCPNLKNAVLPDSVTEIGKGAFDGDKKIAKVTLNGNNLKKVGKNAFRGIKKNAVITIKAKNQGLYKKVIAKIKKAGNKKLKFKFKKAKK